jgi:hypothetical protein
MQREWTQQRSRCVTTIEQLPNLNLSHNSITRWTDNAHITCNSWTRGSLYDPTVQYIRESVKGHAESWCQSNLQHFTTYCGMSPESQNCEASGESLLVNGYANTPVARQWLSSRHIIAVTDKHTTTAELLEAVFSVQSVPRLYNEDQMPLPVSRESNVSRGRRSAVRKSPSRVSRERVCR